MSVILLPENYLDTSTLSSYTKSSEQTAYPATNLYQGKRRSKVWRTAGYWNITSPGNTFVFQETIGVNKTATVAVAEYTTTTLLCAAIKTAMQAVGSSTYTVSADATTGKIKIVSNGSGGAGVFRLIWTSGTSTTMAGILGFDTSADMTGALTYTADILKLHTSEWLRWDLGMSVNPKAFVLVGERNMPLKLSATSTVKLQGNGTDVWTAPSYEATLTWNEGAMVKYSSTGLHTSALRYWRLQIVDTANVNLYVELSSAYLGNALIPVRGAVQFPFKTKLIDHSRSVTTEGGQVIGDVRAKTESLTLDWRGLTVADKESLITYWENLGTTSALFLILDPGAAFTSTDAASVRCVKFAQAPEVTLESPMNFSAVLDFTEEL
jgi:hypothetical protein